MTFTEIIYFVLPIALALAVISFFVGALFYIFSGDKDSNKGIGTKLMAIAISVSLVAIALLALFS